MFGTARIQEFGILRPPARDGAGEEGGEEVSARSGHAMNVYLV